MKKRLGLAQFSITLALGVAIGGLVLVAVAAVLVTQLITSRASVIGLMNQSIQEAFSAIEIALEAHLLPAVDQLEFLGQHIENNDYDLEDREALRHLFVGALAATPQIEGVILVETDLRRLSVRQTLDRALEVQTTPSTDPARLRTLVEEVEASDGVRWYELVHHDGKTYLNLRRPIRQDGEYLGFLASLISIPELSPFMTDFGDYHESTVFILQGREKVLAHPALVSPHPELSEETPVVGSIGLAISCWRPGRAGKSSREWRPSNPRASRSCTSTSAITPTSSRPSRSIAVGRSPGTWAPWFPWRTPWTPCTACATGP